MISTTSTSSGTPENTAADDDMLTWWRTKSPGDLKPAHGKAQELTGHLGEVTDPKMNRARELFPLACSGIPSAAYELGCVLARRLNHADDLAMSWVLAAALLDHSAARIYIAHELARRTSDEYHSADEFNFAFETDIPRHALNADDIRLLRIAREWALRVPAIHAYRRQLAEEFNPAPDATKTGRSSAFRLADPNGPTWSGRPTLRVIEEIADAAHREAKELVKLYGNLTSPLPLAGAGLTPEILEASLNSEFPWMTEVTSRIAGDARLMRMSGSPWFRFRPILLLGPAGVGKTRYAGRLARLTGAGFGVVSAGGSADNRMLAGTARGWSSAQPAYPLLVMSRSACANPIIVIDEIDKAGGDGRNGRIHDTLLGMLEQETAKAWHDEALLAPADLRQVSWVMTANDLAQVPLTLLSRLAVIRVEKPGATALEPILDGIRHDLAREFNTEPEFLPELHPRARNMLAEAFSSGCSIRRIKAAYVSAISKAGQSRRVLH